MVLTSLKSLQESSGNKREIPEIAEALFKDDSVHLHENFPDDPLDLYLKEMASVPLLSHDEEIELAQQIESGRKAQNSLPNPETRLNKLQLQELQQQVHRRNGSS